MLISKIRSWLSCEPGLGDCSAEARRTRRKEFLIKKYSELCELCGHEKKLICRSLARFGASVFFFLEKIQLHRYYSGANR
jgi:hypothetical protein